MQIGDRRGTFAEFSDEDDGASCVVTDGESCHDERDEERDGASCHDPRPPGPHTPNWLWWCPQTWDEYEEHGAIPPELMKDYIEAQWWAYDGMEWLEGEQILARWPGESWANYEWRIKTECAWRWKQDTAGV